jgi:hypothetical protein
MTREERQVRRAHATWLAYQGNHTDGRWLALHDAYLAAWGAWWRTDQVAAEAWLTEGSTVEAASRVWIGPG